MRKRTAQCLLIAFMLCLCATFAARADLNSGSAAVTSDDSMTVFDALGISTGVPEGYDQNEDVTESPYGKTFTTMLEVRELLMETPGASTSAVIYGYNADSIINYDSLNSTRSDLYTKSSVSWGANGNYSISVEGNFSGDNNGRKAQVATLVFRPALFGVASNTFGTGTREDLYDRSKTVNGQLSLYTHSAFGEDQTTVFTYGSHTSFADSIGIGNPIDVDWLLSASEYGLSTENYRDEGDFVNEYMGYNYLKLAAGDFDGDGLDEIAAYIPQMGFNNKNQARVEIFDRQGNGRWSLASSVPLILYDIDGVARDQTHEGRVPNMVSLTAGDFNHDGIDDLAVSYGYVSSDYRITRWSKVVEYSTEHYATIRWGSTYNAATASYMLASSTDFSLITGSGEQLVRTTFTTGDADGDGQDELVLGGSVLNESVDTRYVAVYEWSGSGFSRAAEKSFDLFETDSNTGYRVYESIRDENTYYSVTRTPANVAVGSFFGAGTSPCIYLDSLLIGYAANGELTILDMVKNSSFNLNGRTSNYYYVEYGAQAADLTGSGTDVLITRVHYYAETPPMTGTVKEVLQSDHLLNRNRDYWAAAAVLNFSQDLTQTEPENVYSVRTVKSAESHSGFRRSIRFALPDCDENDTMVLEYTGEHYYTYADPEVLAVLASPPHFKDLEAVADNQMMESSTSYAISSGSGSGSTHTHGFSAGVYASYEADVSIFGVTIFSYEMELEVNNSFTWDFQQTASIEYEISYGTQVGQDSVVLYAMPVETYVYTLHTPDGESQTMTINRPYEPSVEVVAMEKYNSVYAQYPDVLPRIDDVVLTHTVGEPSSYPTSESLLPANRTQTLIYPGDAMRIGYGQVVTGQSITMTQEKENSFSWEIDISFKAGAGSGGAMTGITLGTTHGAGSVSVTTSGSSYSAEMQALPAVAEDYGYGFNWRMVGFLYEGRYPVVTYLVTSLTQPPLLPTDFSANEEETTDDTLVLEWSYVGTAAGFNLYKEYITSAGSDYYLFATVGMSQFDSVNSDGSYAFRYEDTNLEGGSQQKYKIQTIGTAMPNLSIPSGELVVYTKPSNAPVLSVTESRLDIRPDNVVTTSVVVENQSELGNARLYFQWEKQDENGEWLAVNLRTDATLSFRFGSESDAGVYRCRVTAIMNSTIVAVYSPRVTVTHSRRTAEFTGVVTDSDFGTITASLAGTDTLSVPGGNVIFTLDGSQGEVSYTVALENGTAVLEDAGPRDGLYAVTCYYSGNRVFYPAEYDPDDPTFYVKGEGNVQTRFLSIRDTYTYGDRLDFTIYTTDSEGNVIDSEVMTEEFSSITFKRYYSADQSYRRLAEYDGLSGWRYFGFFCGDDGVMTGLFRVESRFRQGLAAWVGSYCFDYTLDGVTKTYYFTINPAKASVTGLETIYTYSKDSVGGFNRDEVKQQLTYTGIIDFADGYRSDLDVFKGNSRYTYRNLVLIDRNGTQYNPSEAPVGSYTLAFNPSGDSDSRCREVLPLQDNYEIEWQTATFVITGDVYQIGTMISDVHHGRTTVISPENATTAVAGQTVVFRCEPYEGYEVYGWWAFFDGAWLPTLIDDSGSETLVHTVYRNVRMMGLLVEKQNTLTVNALPTEALTNGAVAENKVLTDDLYFVQGNVYSPGYEITFTAQADEGWHFVRWEYAESGKSSQYSDDPVFTLIMPDARVVLNAVFEREVYALTLGENLIACDKDGEPITETGQIVGDTEITVRPAPGFAAVDGTWKLNGEAVEIQLGEEGITFVLGQDTAVTVELTAGVYQVSLGTAEEGGTATASATGELNGGDTVTFTAAPARGYAFRGWQDQSGTVVSTEEIFSFTVVSDIGLTPVFETAAAKQVTVSYARKGIVTWRIDGTDPVLTGTVEEYPGVTLEVFPGETLVLTATPNSGKMVAGWMIDEVYSPDAQEVRSFSYDELPSEIEPGYRPITRYLVEFSSPIIVRVDNEQISSTSLVESGSLVEFSYAGEDGVLYWLDGEEKIYSDTYTVELLSRPLKIDVVTGWRVSFETGEEGQVEQQVVSKEENESAEIPEEPEKQGHVFGGWYTSATFEEETAYDFSAPVNGNLVLYAKWDHVHNWQEDLWVFDASGHWLACGNQGCDDTRHEFAEHTPDREEATETESVRCTVCGYVITPATAHTEHTLELVPEKPATCLATGVKEHYACSGCGKLFADAEGTTEIVDSSSLILLITDHTWGEEWHSDGSGHFKICTVCGEQGQASAHTPAQEWSSDESGHWHECETCGFRCDEGGHVFADDADAECDVCGYERHVHAWGETYGHDETHHWLTCTGCNETVREEHAWGEWTTGEGERSRTCTVCGAEQTEEIPAEGSAPVAAIAVGSTVGGLALAYGVCLLLFKKGVLKGAFFSKIFPFIK